MASSPMKIIHRAFAGVLVLLAGVWIWQTVALWRQTNADNLFYEQSVAPVLAATKQQVDTLRKGTSQAQADPVSFAPLDESMRRMERRFEIGRTRDQALFGIMGVSFAWGIVFQVQLYIRRRQSEAPDRPAAINAGALVGDLIERGFVLVANDGQGNAPREVQIDGKRAVVVFRNFTFVARFAGNPKQKLVEMPFSDLLAGWIGSHKGRAFLQLRTTQGKVLVADNVRPFQTLAETLLDAIELNRTSPEAYRAALAREPVVRTAWFGWAIIAGAIAGVIAVGRAVFSD